MEYYYTNTINENRIFLDEEETNHLMKVKRFKIGDEARVVDGKGNLYIAAITGIEKRQAILEIRDHIKEEKKNFHLHIAIAPTKNIDRTEWFLEKVTETGVDEITFLNCMHSERKIIKEERMQKVVVAAMKQSLKTYMPKLNPLISFKDFLPQVVIGDKFICSTKASQESNFHKNYNKGNSLTVLIGPEGDFHDEELEAAKKAGFQPTTLGTSRLRTETAGLAVCTIFNFMNA